MAEVAGRGEIGRLAVLVAAIARDRCRCSKGSVEARVVRAVEREAEDLQIVVAVLALAKPRTDDRGRHRLVLQHPTRRDVGDRNPVLAADLRRGGQNALERLPTAGYVDEALVFRTAPVGDFLRFRLA